MARHPRFDPKRRRPRRGTIRPARFVRRRSGWRAAWDSVRPWVVLIALACVTYVLALPGVMPAPAFLSGEPQVIEGRFTRCGPGRGYYCVVDGDTFKLGDTSVRVVGIDTAERDAQCPAEAVQAEASTRALQGWLNRGPFHMIARLDEPTDRYGRDLRTIIRLRPAGSEERLADYMQSEGGARGYWGGFRDGWC